MLHLQRRSVEIHSFAVSKNVHSVSPLGYSGPQSDFNHSGSIVAGHYGRQRGGLYRPICIVRQLFESTLHVEFEFFRFHVNQHEFAFAVESVLQIVEGNHVRIAKYGSYI